MSCLILEILDKKQTFISKWNIDPNIIIIGKIHYYQLITYYNEMITCIYGMKIIEDLNTKEITVGYRDVELNNETTNVKQVISKEEIIEIIKANVRWNSSDNFNKYAIVESFENIANEILEKIEKNNGGK